MSCSISVAEIVNSVAFICCVTRNIGDVNPILKAVKVKHWQTLGFLVASILGASACPKRDLDWCSADVPKKWTADEALKSSRVASPVVFCYLTVFLKQDVVG